MGYSYSIDPRTRYKALDCDVCGRPGGVRKVPCPFGYCPAIAICPACRSKHPEYTSKASHQKQGCEKRHLEFQRREAREKQLLAQGKYLRCSALGHGDKVKVIFRGNAGEKACLMSQEIYRAIPLGTPATVDDYKKLGKVIEAQSLDIYNPN
jgi:hypothetical protein